MSNEEDEEEESVRRRVVKTVVGAWDNWRVDFSLHSLFMALETLVSTIVLFEPQYIGNSFKAK